MDKEEFLRKHPEYANIEKDVREKIEELDKNKGGCIDNELKELLKDVMLASFIWGFNEGEKQKNGTR